MIKDAIMPLTIAISVIILFYIINYIVNYIVKQLFKLFKIKKNEWIFNKL